MQYASMTPACLTKLDHIGVHNIKCSNKLVLSVLKHMEAYDITLSSVHCDTARHVITTSMADEARPRTAQEHLKLPWHWIA